MYHSSPVVLLIAIQEEKSSYNLLVSTNYRCDQILSQTPLVITTVSLVSIFLFTDFEIAGSVCSSEELVRIILD